jgi:SAM-dependent methyltransferase
MLQEIRKGLVPGVTWQNPIIAAGLRVLDPVDWTVRALGGRTQYPRLSLRVRSNGVRGQFGGARFQRIGMLFAEELRHRAGLNSGSQVLEIGCGCGRNAFALAEYLDDGNYVGVDIDRPSIFGAEANRMLAAKGFVFQLLDVENPEYNPNGRHSAAEYRFEFDNAAFDIIFLVSVFTHMLPKELENYVAEISRMLRPGGSLVFTTFIMDAGTRFGDTVFSYGKGPYRSAHEAIPEICVGYFLDYLDATLSARGLERNTPPVFSLAGGRDVQGETTEFDQDILIAQKPSP